MACQYKIKINDLGGTESKVLYFPSQNNNDYFSTEIFIKDIKNNKLLWENLIDQAQTAYDSYVESVQSNPKLIIQERDSKDALYTVAIKLSQLGIPVKIKDNLPNNIVSYVENGEIILSSKADITAPIHELLHLVFGVMRAENPKQFIELMQGIEASNSVSEKIREITDLDIYRNLMHEDLVEEAFVRVMEDLLSDKIAANNTKIIYNGEEILVYDFLDTVLKQPISRTFGIPDYKLGRVSIFLKSPISNLPLLGSSLFQRSSLITNGYSDKQNKARLGGQVMNFIKQQIKQGHITQGEC